MSQIISDLIIQILKHEATVTALRCLLYSHYYPFIYICQALYISTFLLRSCQGIYISFIHKLVLAFLCCIVIESPFDIIFANQTIKGNPILIFDKYFRSFFFLFAFICINLFVFEKIPEKIQYLILKYTTIPVNIMGAIYQSRIFSAFLPIFPDADERLILILSFVLSKWIHFIDIIMRKLTNKRTEISHSSFSYLFKTFLACAFSFSLGHRSVISGIVGIFPLPYVSFVFLVLHTVINLFS